MSIVLFGTREIETPYGTVLLQVFYNDKRETFSFDFCIKAPTLHESDDVYNDAQSAFKAGEAAALSYNPEE